MGKKLNAVLGRSTKQTSKLKALFDLCISRIAILRKQHQTRCSQARGDIDQLIQLGHQDRALSRAEQVIKEQNLLDAFVLIEGYCNLLTERIALLEYQIECPDELRDAISSLIFAASRSGELPELQDIRRKFAVKFGREFASAAVDLRSNCRVNPMMIQKLSTRRPSLESKSRIIREIALEKGIQLDGEGHPVEIKEVETKMSASKMGRNLSRRYKDDSSGVDQVELHLQSMGARQKYNNVGSTTDQRPVVAKKEVVEHIETEGWSYPSNELSEKCPVRSMNKDENIAVHTVSGFRRESPLSSRNSIKLDMVKSREEFVVPPQVEGSSTGFSLLNLDKPHFQIKRAILHEHATGSNTTESVLEEKESEDQKTYSLGNQFEKKYGVGVVSLPNRRLMSLINAALEEEFHDKDEELRCPRAL
ncbi:Vacuolar protein sorting-associated protein Ist1 protein [Dioscorea alata]|uniref:Vacuolar protein sorting-associated protein Ist1 protein n=1 Tax=Dioscorea alata TaxID=55571 RepID=A0ACB7TXW9_DIOAL|nr:Vacuolar protein sorting-associated protein Ist1 protein [Dioscorea alata]